MARYAVTRGPTVQYGLDGDADLDHCSAMRRWERSDNVRVNGRGISRQTDCNVPHRYPTGVRCDIHCLEITLGSLKVRVNGLGCGRIFDDVGGPACTAVAEGSFNVFAG